MSKEKRFECIYHNHAMLDTYIRCLTCGTVIFTGDDERYNPNLVCPVCNPGTHPGCDYWTGEDIKNDPNKQHDINIFIKMQKDLNDMYERVEKRGLNDWEIWKKKFFEGRSIMFDITLERMNFWGEKLKGLNLHIWVWQKKEDNIYTSKYSFRIPLSPYAVYILCIFKYTKKCKDKSLRKYLPWQKKEREANEKKN